MKLTPAGGPEATLEWSNSEKAVWKISAGSYSDTLMAPIADIKKGEKFELTDAVVDIGRFARQHVRPRMKRYCSSYDCEAAYLDIVREWQKLPRASEHVLDLDFRPLANGQVEVYMDGSYIKKLSKPLVPVTSKGAQENVALAKLNRVAVKFPAKTTYWARVKGNSNWGQVRFEIEVARGEVFKNLSTGRSWGCDIMDWPGNLCVNFDGWGVVYQTLTKTRLVNDHSPGPYTDQWVSEGGDKVILFPIKVRAITVGMNRQKLDLLDFKKSAPAIRISAIGVTGT